MCVCSLYCLTAWAYRKSFEKLEKEKKKEKRKSLETISPIIRRPG